MNADSSVIVVPDDPKALRDELAAVLTAFEQATGVQVCFRPMSERWKDTEGLSVVLGPFTEHRSPFCQAVKAKSLPACTKCDYVDLPAVCAPPEGRVVEPFVRTCHAGAEEVLLPLWSEGVLVAVLFVGQFRRKDSDLAGTGSLRHLNDAEVRRLRTLTLPLRSYLMEALRRLDSQHREHPAGRRGAIESYIRESLSDGPALPELASSLSLSRSRTSHVVRELTGDSFQNLVAERRIAVAKDLLAGTDGTVAWVAHQTGFKDTGYFCRYFKRKTGITPTTFRKHHSRVRSV